MIRLSQKLRDSQGEKTMTTTGMKVYLWSAENRKGRRWDMRAMESVRSALDHVLYQGDASIFYAITKTDSVPSNWKTRKELFAF